MIRVLHAIKGTAVERKRKKKRGYQSAENNLRGGRRDKIGRVYVGVSHTPHQRPYAGYKVDELGLDALRVGAGAKGRVIGRGS